MLVMAALMMADDLFEAENKLKTANKMIPSGVSVQPIPDLKLGRKLVKLAKHAEDIAARLESP